MGTESHRVMITCPQTGKPVFTELKLSREAWDTWEIEQPAVRCPHCGQEHAWTKDEAYLESASA